MTNRDVSHTLAPSRGFTLVELMVTVAVVAILMAIGAPQLRAFLQKQQVAADMESITTAMRQARSEALKRSGRVTVCALSNAAITNPANAQCAAANNADWSNGWMVFIDYSIGGANAFDSASDTILHIEQSVHSRTIRNTSGSIVTYLADGQPLAFSNGTFVISPGTSTNDPLCRTLVLSRQGRVTKGSC
jgi:type IV fimbrial biogenesis protein FimT